MRKTENKGVISLPKTPIAYGQMASRYYTGESEYDIMIHHNNSTSIPSAISQK